MTVSRPLACSVLVVLALVRDGNELVLTDTAWGEGPSSSGATVSRAAWLLEHALALRARAPRD